MTISSNLDVFLKKVGGGGGGGGVISNPKNYIADFLVSQRYILVVNFGVISDPKNFIANLRKLAHIYELLQQKA